MTMYKCECGREFEKLGSYRSHRRFCDLHEHHKEYVSKSIYKISENLYRCECGREFDNHQGLNGHFTNCKIHRISIGKPETPTCTHIGTRLDINISWSDYLKEKIKNIPEERKQEFHKKSGETYRRKIQSREIIHHWVGKHHTKETKEKQRLAAIKRIGYSANYSKVACKYIDNLNKEKGWNLQHAMNGGEKTIHGYYLDGYDEKLNIAFEYDEAKHYTDVENNILRSKDQERQDIIIESLHCRMFRYNEETKTLYEAKPSENLYLYIEDAIKDNKIDYTSRMSIKNSLKSLGLSWKKFDLFVEIHPEYGIISHPRTTKKEKEEKRIEKKRKREEKNNKKIERKTYFSQLRKEAEEKRNLICQRIRENLNKIDLNKWNRLKQVSNILEPELGKLTNKTIVIALKRDQELYNLIRNRKNIGSSNQKWIHNPLTNETIRIKESELEKYNGWILGRK